MPNFNRRFAEPIRLANGPVLATLRDAAEIIGGLASFRQQPPTWEYAAELVLWAATTGRKEDVEEARLQILRALRTDGTVLAGD